MFLVKIYSKYAVRLRSKFSDLNLCLYGRFCMFQPRDIAPQREVVQIFFGFQEAHRRQGQLYEFICKKGRRQELRCYSSRRQNDPVRRQPLAFRVTKLITIEHDPSVRASVTPPLWETWWSFQFFPMAWLGPTPVVTWVINQHDEGLSICLFLSLCNCDFQRKGKLDILWYLFLLSKDFKMCIHLSVWVIHPYFPVCSLCHCAF